MMGLLSLASRSCVLTPSGYWLAAIPEDQWDISDDEKADALQNWDAQAGDRLQELVMIGRDMDQAEMTKALDACLVDERYSFSKTQTWSDPFPAWDESPEQVASV